MRILNTVVSEYLTEKGAFEQKPEDMRERAMWAFCRRNSAFLRGNTLDKEIQEVLCIWSRVFTQLIIRTVIYSGLEGSSWEILISTPILCAFPFVLCIFCKV